MLHKLGKNGEGLLFPSSHRGQKVLNNCYQEKMFRETFYGQGCTRRGEGLLGTVHEQKKIENHRS